MHFIKLIICTIFFVFLNSMHATSNNTLNQSQQFSSIEPSYKITTRHIEHKGIGYNEGYTTLEGFFPLYKKLDCWIPFLDTRYHIFNNGKPAINAGVGLRYLANNRIYGINSYYDYRNTNHQHYNQLSIGFESLGITLDARLNCYLPIGKTQSHNFKFQFDQFKGNNAILKHKYEYALAGINAEGGYHINYWEKIPLYFAAGPYYLTGKGGTTWGAQLRASANIFNYLKIDTNISYDHFFKWIGQGQVGLTFSLKPKKDKLKYTTNHCSSSSTLEKIKYQSVDRFEIIPINTKHTRSIAINPNTNSPYQFIFVDNMSSSFGTYESPYSSLAIAEINSNPYDIIYVFPGNGTTKNMDHGIVLKPNQKLFGSAKNHIIPTTGGLITIPEFSSTTPQITNIDLLQNGATLSTKNEINGIKFIQTSGKAIYGIDPIAVNISSCTFSECGNGDLGIFPILVQTSTPFSAIIENNNFIDNPNGGVFVKLIPGSSSTQIKMNNNQATNNQASSGGASIINIEGHGSVGACFLNMLNNIYKNNNCGAVNITDFDSPHEGEFTSFQGVFISNIFTNNSHGITFKTNAENCNLSIKENDLSNNTTGSILVLAGDAGTKLINHSSVIIDSNQINQCGTAGDAINISPAGETASIVITNNSIKNNNCSGFVSFFNQPGPNTTLLISNNIIANNLNLNYNASGGISFDEFNSVTAIIKNNIFYNNTLGNSIGNFGGAIIPDTSNVSFINNKLTENDTFSFKFFGNNPSTGCLTILDNTSSTETTYTFEKNGSGQCFIVPCNYEAENTGGFNIIPSDVNPSIDCLGTSCFF